MSIRAYGMCYCSIPEKKVEELCLNEFEDLKLKMEYFDVDMTDIGRYCSYDDIEQIYDEIDCETAMEKYSIDDKNEAINTAAKEIADSFDKLCEEFKEKTGYTLEVVTPDSETYAGDEYYWVTTLDLSRKLKSLDAQIVTWVEYG